MTDGHWDATALRGLLDGSLPEAATAELRRHLAGCERCQAFFASTEAAAVFDPAASSLLPEVDGLPSPSAEEVRRMRLAVLGQTSRARDPRGGGWSWVLGLSGAGVLGALLAALLWLPGPQPAAPGSAIVNPPDPLAGVKGTVEAPLRVELTFLARGPEQPPREERGQDGGRYGPEQTLVFRLHTLGRAHLRLVRVPADGEAEWLFPEEPEPAGPLAPGVYYLEREGRPLAYSLRGLTGPQVFVLLGSLERLPPRGELADWFRRHRPVIPRSDPEVGEQLPLRLRVPLPAGLVADVLTVVVEPPHGQ